MKVLDPLCGLGTIPRVILAEGGDCIGVESDIERYTYAAAMVKGADIRYGDYRRENLPRSAFDYIFTSFPFEWFRSSAIISHVNSDYAEWMKTHLSPHGSLLIDSLPLAHRENEYWPVAKNQSVYLINNGFSLRQVISFTEQRETGPLTSVVMQSVIAA